MLAQDFKFEDLIGLNASPLILDIRKELWNQMYFSNFLQRQSIDCQLLA